MAIPINAGVWFAGTKVTGSIPLAPILADAFSVNPVTYGVAQHENTDTADAVLNVTAGGAAGSVNLYRRDAAGPEPATGYGLFIGAFQVKAAEVIAITLSGVRTAPLIDQEFYLENKTTASITVSMDITPRAVGPKA